jgi:hypothetical protein
MKLFCLLVITVSLLLVGCAKPANELQAAGVVIISATYGSGTNFVDVTGRVNELLGHPHANFFVHPQSLGDDPTPGWNKTLVIVYEFKRQRHILTTGEGDRVSVADLLHAAEL